MKLSNNKRITLIIILIVFVMVCSVANYNHRIAKISKERTDTLLSDNNNEIIKSLKKNFEIRADILKVINKAYNSTQNYDQIKLDKYFSRIEVHNRSDFDDRDYASELTQNGLYISKPFVDGDDKKIFFDVLIDDNTVVRGICKIKNLFDTLELRTLSDNIYTYAANSDGEIIFLITGDEEGDIVWNNIFDLYSRCEFGDKNDFYDMADNLKKNIGGCAQYICNKKRYFVNYRTFHGLYIFSVAPQNISFKRTSEVVLLTSHMLFILFSSISILFLYIFHTNKKHIKQMFDSNQKMETLIENIPGGVVSKLYDSDLSLKYMSYGFFKLTGYEPHEIKSFFGNKFKSLIYFDDIQRLKKKLDEQLKYDNRFQIEYRITRKNGEIVWLFERGQLKDNLISSVILDITQIKNIWDKLVNNEHKYKLIAEQANSVIFELDIRNNLIYSTDTLSKLIGFDLNFSDFPQNIINKNLITNTDAEILNKWLESIKLGRVTDAIEIRLKNNKYELMWYRLSSKLIFDEIKQPTKAVCKIENIDNQKQDQEELKKRAQTDLLTGLYNKSATQDLIEQYIKSDNAKNAGAMFAIDIDNFKGVNDNLGHLAGDKVLKDVADKFKNIFRKTDIIGRFGGDEFIVFVKDVPSQEFLENKAKEILNNVRAKINNDDRCKISASIGIALYPKHGFDFHELYKNADEALYLSKRSGKDSWSMFKPL